MPRIDDYREALRIAKREILERDPEEMALKAKGEFEKKDGVILVKLFFLTEPCQLRIENNEVNVESQHPEREISLTDQVLIAHYLLGVSYQEETGEWITFRDIPDGHFYYDAFLRRARDPFLKTFGSKPELYEKVAPMLGGIPVKGLGDVAFDFKVFPKVTVRIVLWKGDEEFPPEASILFDRSIQSNLPIEDIAYLSGGVVYRMMGIARSLG
ncbi:MAG: DUF3786 domain-containing protein [Syntrophobacterales bacterium]|nr:DUF3786 domain-containing protein [Syntrophobacterales bacterium]